jgi:hypothetical protein
MTRKTVQIKVPAPAPAAPARPAKPVTRTAANANATMDGWIAQAREATEALGAKIEESLGESAFAGKPPGKGVSIKVDLSTEPSFAEAAKVFFVLPQAALWFWSVGLARKTLHGFQYWHR